MGRVMAASRIEYALSSLGRNRLAGWILFLVYALAVTLPHEYVQDLAGKLATSIGRANLYRFAAALAITLATLVTIQFLRRTRRPSLIIYWFATLLFIAATWATLTANNTELVHYPQYFVPGLLLFALTRSPLETLCWILLAGGCDEWFQYAVLHGGWGVPYDFNDVFMNLLGGALGMLFGLAYLPAEKPKARPASILVAAVLLSAVVLYFTGKLLLYQDPSNHDYWFALSRLKPQPFWFFDATWGPRTFHTLSPLEGPALLLATLALYSRLEERGE